VGLDMAEKCSVCGAERNIRDQPFTVFGLHVHVLQVHGRRRGRFAEQQGAQ